MEKDAEVRVIESGGASSKPTGYVQIIYCILFLLKYHRVLKALEDEGISVAPLRCHAHPVSSTEALPALSLEDIHPQGSSCTTGGIFVVTQLLVTIVQLTRRT